MRLFITDKVTRLLGSTVAFLTCTFICTMAEHPTMEKKSGSGASSIWETKDGRLIPVDEMTDEHLLNTVRLFKVYDTNLVSLSKEMQETWHDLNWEVFFRGLLHGETGEQLREPYLEPVDLDDQQAAINCLVAKDDKRKSTCPDRD